MILTFMAFFPMLCGIIDALAAAVYLWQGQRALAVTWFCYAIAAVALGQVKNS